MMELFSEISMAILLLALFLAIFRLIKGPSLPDKVISLDQISFVSMGIIIVNIFLSGEPVYLDMVLVLALIIFLGTVVIAKYLKRKMDDQ